MPKIGLLMAIFMLTAVFLAAHSFHNEYSDLPLRTRGIKTVIYGLGPWLCAFAFAGAKWAFQILLRKQPSGFRHTFTWVGGIVVALMITAKIIS